ncbi:hypothetical protein CAPTEDRAFT_227716 [Capitella teleta]|uniref:Uncharacterized protein n=1 Tax=Capitella teleta TaxID=283909 RepID=R7U936_CAPTE|nr:hypothetical protein CAPTEDRAFT_227716 [Capitella teleta]|eukprot:ELT99645.1 hypothetical protein CAPTEDRAFT_227716 [Capitella teleta]
MGSCLSYDFEDRKAQARSVEIDKQLMDMAHEDRRVIKLLLLGAGESGKSTLVKQMKIIYTSGFSENELMAFRPAVLDNLLFSMKFVLSGMGMLRINLERPYNRANAQIILSCQRCYDDHLIILPNVAVSLQSLWKDGGVRRAISRGYEFELNDSAIYYFENMHRLCSEKFVPTVTDVLRARVRTQGVIETCFKFRHCMFRMFDVGGQRSERRKWIHCFDNVHAIIFVAALSGYDMTLAEDPSINRLEESLRIFKQICSIPFFRRAILILFLNKMDLFTDKITRFNRHLKYYFHNFKGPIHEAQPAAEFIRDMFISHAIEAGKHHVYSHVTTATDTNQVQSVFCQVVEGIVQANLSQAQLL